MEAVQAGKMPAREKQRWDYNHKIYLWMIGCCSVKEYQASWLRLKKRNYHSTAVCSIIKARLHRWVLPVAQFALVATSKPGLQNRACKQAAFLVQFIAALWDATHETRWLWVSVSLLSKRTAFVYEIDVHRRTVLKSQWNQIRAGCNFSATQVNVKPSGCCHSSNQWSTSNSMKWCLTRSSLEAFRGQNEPIKTQRKYI